MNQKNQSSNLTLDGSLFEELSEVELEAVSGGAGLIQVDVINNDILKNVNVGVNAAVLSTKPALSNNFPLVQA
ncbi:MAG: hypothetical protein ACM37W_09495 [Actinomycetota bacterium]